MRPDYTIGSAPPNLNREPRGAFQVALASARPVHYHAAGHANPIPGPDMQLRGLIICLVLGLLVLGLSGPAYAQSGYDRPGGDYSSFQVRSGDPAVCAARCEREGRCRAWNFSYPGTVTASAMCWLKSQVTTRVAQDCCVSGVKGAAVLNKKSDTVEFSMDRTGGDYKNLDVAADAAGATCESACKGEDRCRAWTYVRPGYLGPSARCFLKERITRPRHKPCCVSGVVR